MIRHTVLRVGDTASKYLREGEADYLRRLRNYSRIAVKSVGQKHQKPGASSKQREKIKIEECRALVDRAPEMPPAYWIALDEGGQLTTSVNFSKFLMQRAARGSSHFVWFIGGPLGLTDDLTEGCRLVLSLSRMTFPHEMVPMILMEQLYRAHKIARGEPYHT